MTRNDEPGNLEKVGKDGEKWNTALQGGAAYAGKVKVK
jgi:hypothetical protein